ncbi:MAG: acetate/propionate family kinase [Thermodesulfobacteriota bacterium]
MKVLVINCGSSTLKFKVIELEPDTPAGQEQRLVRGIVEKIGSEAMLKFVDERGPGLEERVRILDHGGATERVFDWLGTLGYLKARGIDGVGYRVVHGGPHFLEPTLIDDRVLEAIEAISHLALLHNHPSIEAIRAARVRFGPSMPMVAVFDTTFHSDMPERASHYPIPLELTEKHHAWRYGFHGIAHRYMVERYAVMTSTPLEKIRIITLQLGSGCSATAVKAGRSVDTSMGLTPLEGLMMGTRSGDVDPHLPGFLAERERISPADVEVLLNTKSGLLGVSGLSQDMRELLEAESKGNERAALAVEMFCYRVKKQIGAYLAALGGTDAVVFGGGIGENSPPVRSRICAGMEWCGMVLDEDRNNSMIGKEGKVSRDEARVEIYVVPVDEAVMIARDTIGCLIK